MHLLAQTEIKLLLLVIAVRQQTPILIIFIVGLFVNLGQAETVPKKFMAHLNHLRKQVRIGGVRKYYWDEDLAREAETRANNCDSSLEIAGNRDVTVINMAKYPPETAADIINNDSELFTFNKKVFDRRNGGCRGEDMPEICRMGLKLNNPEAYKIGCAMKEGCGDKKGYFICVLNRKMRKDKVNIVNQDDICNTCTESFKCEEDNGKKWCVLKDESMTSNLPEDYKEVPAGVRAVELQTAGQGPRSNNNVASAVSISVALAGFLVVLSRFLVFIDP
ncbi:hypothetical protein Ciccas_005428 [Cichlidogyrus casuarinus]|uniref:SCP domain-containing protein n=1 Tax=Cichlidogyrus casuarinus TaxID=1844966 RepID=A0ABD2Q9M6_9PLAT